MVHPTQRSRANLALLLLVITVLFAPIGHVAAAAHSTPGAALLGFSSATPTPLRLSTEVTTISGHKAKLSVTLDAAVDLATVNLHAASLSNLSIVAGNIPEQLALVAGQRQ